MMTAKQVRAAIQTKRETEIKALREQAMEWCETVAQEKLQEAINQGSCAAYCVAPKTEVIEFIIPLLREAGFDYKVNEIDSTKLQVVLQW